MLLIIIILYISGIW